MSVDDSSLYFDGFNADASEIKVLKAALKSNPGDLSSRLRLLGYYERKRNKPGLLKHLNWLIENEPTLKIYEYSAVAFDKDTIGQLNKLWDKQLRAHPTSAQVAFNAASTAGTHYPQRAERLFRSAKNLAPDDDEFPRALSNLYGMLAMNGPSKYGDKCVEELMLAYELHEKKGEHDCYMTPYAVMILNHQAEQFIVTGYFMHAQLLAYKLLSFDQRISEWTDADGIVRTSVRYPNAHEAAHVILGRVALREGDFETADKHLLKQLEGVVPRSIALVLAGEFLHIGRTEKLPQFFERCAEIFSWRIGAIQSQGLPLNPDFKNPENLQAVTNARIQEYTENIELTKKWIGQISKNKRPSLGWARSTFYPY